MSNPSSRAQSPAATRDAANARLAEPLPSINNIDQQLTERLQSGDVSEPQTPLPPSSEQLSPGQSHPALANALHAVFGTNSSRSQPHSQDSPHGQDQNGQQPRRSIADINNDDFEPSSHNRSGEDTPNNFEDFDVIRRHLVSPTDGSALHNDAGGDGTSTPQSSNRGHAGVASDPQQEESADPAIGNEGFSSLRLQGGDITREIYRRTEAEVQAKKIRPQRSKSMNVARPGPEVDTMDVEHMREPGGFRRDYLIRQNPNVSNNDRRRYDGVSDVDTSSLISRPNFVTRNFYEFLSLYGHFAGEDVDEDDDEPESSEAASQIEEEEDQEDAGERTSLLKRIRRRRRKTDAKSSKKTARGTLFILLKAFIGTGVLFLPRAFMNGGLLFSCCILFGVACMSYYCFLLLTTSRVALKGSYAEMGDMTNGKIVRFLISGSLVLSQVGFAASYVVFTSENLRAFVLAVTDCKTKIDIKAMIFIQLIVFLPLSLYRNLENISYVVYTADIFIVLGLIYIYYYGIATLAVNGLADVVVFNRANWPLFVGTAVFTFEGIGLLIPIQDGMKNPAELPRILIGVMIIISTIFISMGAISYSAYGSSTETVITLNLPQESKFVNGVQFIYSLAILLSTPMQIFPAITILEKGVFPAHKSGKYSTRIKWYKNVFRFCVIIATALISWLGAGDLDKFVALVGSFACVPLIYIYPPLIHRKAVAKTRRARIIDIVICVLGLMLMIYTSVLTITSWVNGPKSEPKPGYCDRIRDPSGNATFSM